MMDVTSLEISCDADGTSKVTAWVKCRSGEDIDDVIMWLGMARTVMLDWKSVRTQRGIVTAANVTSIGKGKDK